MRRLLCTNAKILEPDNLDLIHDFDSCTILTYFSYKDVKLASQMGSHCDNMNSINGVYSKFANSQIENTPVVIVSFGETRTFNFQQMQLIHNNNTSKKWSKDSDFVQSMVMNSNSIIILNPADKKPHYMSGSDVSVKYRHRNILVKDTGQMSFALVFRVVQRYENYNTLNNALVTNTDNMTPKEKEEYIERENLYKAFDYTNIIIFSNKCTLI